MTARRGMPRIGRPRSRRSRRSEQYVRLRSAILSLQWAIDRYRREKQAPMLKRAGELFAVLTGGSFQTLQLEFDEHDNVQLAGIRKDGRRVPVAGTSTGSADQLYLALRMCCFPCAEATGSRNIRVSPPAAHSSLPPLPPRGEEAQTTPMMPRAGSRNRSENSPRWRCARRPSAPSTRRHHHRPERRPRYPGAQSSRRHGVSVEDGSKKSRIRHLQEAPAGVRFVSIEPLIGPMGKLYLVGIDWVIAGGESGPRARPMTPEWVRDVRDQCCGNGVAFFFKQWGGLRPKSNGRELDGREWSDFPKPVLPYPIAAE